LAGVGWTKRRIYALDDMRPRQAVQKYFKKNEKNTCHGPISSLIPSAKPNQTPMEKPMIRTINTKFGFVRTALAVGVAIPILAGSGAFAQQPAPVDQGPIQPGNAGAIGAAGGGSQPSAIQPGGGAAEVERIIVTGSNIPTAEEVGPNPVLSINRDLIDKSGMMTAENLLKALPVVNGGGIPVSNNATGFTPGATAISLRGLGPEATLVLMDGRRLAPYPIGNGGTGSFFDLRSIPESAIESIEILKDGASTTYGADAIAGVVNIKMRHDYHGAEATIEYGNTTDKDSGEVRADIVFGIGDGNTQITGSMNYYKRNSIFAHDRGYSAVPPFLSGNSTPSNLELSFDVIAAAGGGPAAIAGFGPDVAVPGAVLYPSHAPFGSNGLTPPSAYTYGSTSRFNFNATASSFPDLENYGGFVNFSHKIFGDQMVLFGDFLYENSKSHNELAPGATGAFLTPGSVVLAIPPPAPFAGGITPPNTPTYAETGVPLDAFNPFNPFNQIVSGATQTRLFEAGNRKFDDQTHNFVTTIGLQGDKLFDGTWGYDMGFRYNNVQTTSASSQTSSTLFDRVNNQADPVFGPGGALEGRNAYNMFADSRATFIPDNYADLAFATVHPKDVDTSEIGTLDLNIYTTELFKLPAGGVGFAFGAQFRKEQLVQDVDQINIIADVPGNSPSATTNAGRKDWAIYAEASIPIFSPTFNFPGFYALELTAAVRYEVFENNNTNACVPKFGVRWQPFDETLTIRGTIGEGFREPSLLELFASPVSGLTPVTDILPFSLGGPNTPVGDPSRNDPEQPVVVTSSPTLQPEDSRSWTTGVVWTPKFASGLTVSVDLWDTERTGVVIQSALQDVLQREVDGALLPGEITERSASGTLLRVFTPFINSGSLKANGIDMGAQYVYPTRFGTFTSLTNATWLNSFKISNAPGAPQVQHAGEEVPGVSADDGYLKWKGNSSIDWSWNGWDLVTTVRFLDGFHEREGRLFDADGTPAFHYVKQEWLFDGQLSYDFTFVAPVETQPVPGYSKDAKDMEKGKDGKAVESAPAQTANAGLPIWKRCLNGTSITIGCNDIFGQDPPFASGQAGNSNGYPGFLYDSTGRFVYVSLTKKF
jgi:iron complex outermembrane recepter protein